MKGVLLVGVLIALALPGAGTARTPPASPAGMPPPGACESAACLDPEPAGEPAGNLQPAPAPDENEHLADYFLLALLGSLVVIVPVIVTRQRNARESSRPSSSPRPALRLVWRRGEKVGGD